MTEVVEAVSSRDVFTVEILPWSHRWGPTLTHVRSMHQAPLSEPLNPGRLAHCHRTDHLDFIDPWTASGHPLDLHPHRHLSLVGRLRTWWEMRP